jgi:hypothetical protein
VKRRLTKICEEEICKLTNNVLIDDCLAFDEIVFCRCIVCIVKAAENLYDGGYKAKPSSPSKR